MSGQLTPRERDQFFRKLGWNGKGTFRERRTCDDGVHILGLQREYRTARRAMAPDELNAYFAELRVRIDEFEAGATV